jgi:hypothetical protein
VRDEDAGVAGRLGVYADYALAVQVLCDVGDEAVLPDDDDDVAGLEQEAGQVGPLYRAAPPRAGDGGGDGGDGILDELVAVRGASRSGLRTRLPICGRFPASSWTARASRVPWGSSR